MPEITNIRKAHTGDKCFHCRKHKYQWRMQIHTDKPEGIVNICLCGSCVLLPVEDLIKPLMKEEGQAWKS